MNEEGKDLWEIYVDWRYNMEQEANLHFGIIDFKDLCDSHGVRDVLHYIKKEFPDLYVTIADSIECTRSGSREDYDNTFIRGTGGH